MNRDADAVAAAKSSGVECCPIRASRALEKEVRVDVDEWAAARERSVSGQRSASSTSCTNAELVAVIADVLGVPKRDVTLVAGERSRHKRLRVAGITTEAAAERLAPPR